LTRGSEHFKYLAKYFNVCDANDPQGLFETDDEILVLDILSPILPYEILCTFFDRTSNVHYLSWEGSNEMKGIQIALRYLLHVSSCFKHREGY
jgi:hypothetical protein